MNSNDDEIEEAAIDPEVLASIYRGLQQAEEGKTVYLGSFAEYADEEPSSKVRTSIKCYYFCSS